MKQAPVFVVLFVAGVVFVLAAALQTKILSQHAAFDALAADVEELKRQAAGAAVKFDLLKALVMTPKFARHQGRCKQCSPDCVGEEGPCSLCEEGFELLQQDLAEGGSL